MSIADVLATSLQVCQGTSYYLHPSLLEAKAAKFEIAYPCLIPFSLSKMSWLTLSKTPKQTETSAQDAALDSNVLTDGTVQFVAESGANTSKTTYQDASGAPVESVSPLGYSVGAITIIFLNLSKMVGTGVFSTRAELRLLNFAHMLIVLSINNTGRCWLSWHSFVLLGRRLPHRRELALRIYGVCLLLSESIWIRNRVPGASVSPAKVFLPDGFCYADGPFVVQQ